MTTRELFARLIKCEAGGEGEIGMKGVATVVMNRVNVAGGQYLRTGQGDLRRIIEEPGEFTCMMSTVYGEINPQTVWVSTPEDIHYEIADWALSGNKLIGVDESLWYYNPFQPVCAQYFPRNGSGVIHNRIQQHCFYIPTPLYYET
ncbi:MAG: cell wall hydrolase [Clostridiales bacterium]|jgi:N-acetylmuramoyl-L-alanine amidase|nr:cell wall hydrolase [Eubacteriales bacterium]MDH7567774.1 cell wall hydrolase [Clostridiales bacterium]